MHKWWVLAKQVTFKDWPRIFLPSMNNLISNVLQYIEHKLLYVLYRTQDIKDSIMMCSLCQLGPFSLAQSQCHICYNEHSLKVALKRSGLTNYVCLDIFISLADKMKYCTAQTQSTFVKIISFMAVYVVTS